MSDLRRAHDLPTIYGAPRNTAIPHRRMRLVLDLEADDLDGLARSLGFIADDIEREGRTVREVTEGGSTAGFHLVIGEDPEVSAESFQADLAEWSAARRRDRVEQ